MNPPFLSFLFRQAMKGEPSSPTIMGVILLPVSVKRRISFVPLAGKHFFRPTLHKVASLHTLVFPVIVQAANREDLCKRSLLPFSCFFSVSLGSLAPSWHVFDVPHDFSSSLAAPLSLSADLWAGTRPSVFFSVFFFAPPSAFPLPLPFFVSFRPCLFLPCNQPRSL